MTNEKIEKALQYIKNLVEHSADIFWIKSIDYKEQIYISPAYEKIWGRNCESLYDDAKSWMDYVFPEDLHRINRSIEEFRNDQPESNRWHTVEYRIRRPDGQEFYLSESCVALFDEEKNCIGYGGTIRDITSEKKYQEVKAVMHEISDERDVYEAHLRRTIESIAGNHWWKDREGVYRGYNHTLLKSLGYQSPDEILGKTDYDLPWSAHADELVAHDREVMRRGVPIEREEEVLSPTGEIRVFLVNKAPLRDAKGEVIGTIGHGFDITEIRNARHQLETAKQNLEKEKEKIQERFNSVIGTMINSHWVKDLEGHYLACNDALAKEFGLSGANEMVGKTDFELPWSGLAEEFIAFDREVIESGMPVTREGFIRDRHGKKRFYVVTKIPLRNNFGDIIGTIANATDITMQKQVEKELEAARKRAWTGNQTPSHYLFSLCGEIKENLSSVLSLAKSLESEVSGQEAKSLVHRLQESAKAIAAVTSRASVIESEMSETDSEEFKSAPEVLPDKTVFKETRALLVEDNLLNQRILKMLLEDLGCHVTLAVNGREAIEKADDHFDLIFMDIGLPEMDGITASEQLLKNEKTKNIPIVFLSAHIDEDDYKRCRGLGMKHVLTKPVVMQDLQSVLSDYGMSQVH